LLLEGLVVFAADVGFSVDLVVDFSPPFSADEVFPAGVEVPFVDEARGRLGRSTEDGAGVETREGSLEENMRVRRFLTEDLSGGFK